MKGVALGFAVLGERRGNESNGFIIHVSATDFLNKKIDSGFLVWTEKFRFLPESDQKPGIPGPGPFMHIPTCDDV